MHSDFYLATPGETIKIVLENKKDEWWGFYDTPPLPSNEVGEPITKKRIPKQSMDANEHRIFYGFHINGWEQATLLATAAHIKSNTALVANAPVSSASVASAQLSSASVSSAGEEDDEEDDEEEDA